MEMKVRDSISVHMKLMKELSDKLATIGAAIAEEDQVVTLLGSLSASYLTLVTVLEARDDLILSYVQQSLIQDERKLNEEYLVSNDRSAGDGSLGMFSDEHEGDWKKRINGQQKLQNWKLKCYNCGETGHFR